MLVLNGAAKQIVKLVVGKDIRGLESLVRQRGHQTRGIRRGVVDRGEVHIEELDLRCVSKVIATSRTITDQIRVIVNGRLDAFTRESLFTETPLDVVENLGLDWVVLVQHVLELHVRRTETVAEMLSEDPATI